MRIVSLFTLALLPLTALSAKKAPPTRFEKFHSKALSTSPIRLDDASYEDLTKAPRDFSAVVLLTALEARFGCHLCKEFQPEWDILAKSWTRGDKQGGSKVLFGTLDFTDGKATFQKVRYLPTQLTFPQLAIAGRIHALPPVTDQTQR